MKEEREREKKKERRRIRWRVNFKIWGCGKKNI